MLSILLIAIILAYLAKLFVIAVMFNVFLDLSYFNSYDVIIFFVYKLKFLSANPDKAIENKYVIAY